MRKDANSEGDGLHMVDDGIVAIKSSTGIALIFERSNWDIYGHKAGGKEHQKLKINIRLQSVRFIKIHSKFLHNSGATMIITGVFDQKKQEVILIRMSRNDAELVLTALRRLGL